MRLVNSACPLGANIASGRFDCRPPERELPPSYPEAVILSLPAQNGLRLGVGVNLR